MIAPLPQPDRRKALETSFAVRLSTNHTGKHDIFECGQLRQEKITLKNETHLLVSQPREHRFTNPIKLVTFEFHFAGLRALQSSEGIEKRRLAGSGSAAQKQ